jgi:hypothetical protein
LPRHASSADEAPPALDSLIRSDLQDLDKARALAGAWR